MGRKHTHARTRIQFLMLYPHSCSSQTAYQHYTQQTAHWQRETMLVHLQYDEVFWSVWLKCKFLTIENFESISLAFLTIDFCWFDSNWEKASVLHSEGFFEGDVWLLDFRLWNEEIQFIGEKFNARKPVNTLGFWRAKALCKTARWSESLLGLWVGNFVYDVWRHR